MADRCSACFRPLLHIGQTIDQRLRDQNFRLGPGQLFLPEFTANPLLQNGCIQPLLRLRVRCSGVIFKSPVPQVRAERREDSSPFPPQRPRLHPLRSPARLARCSDADPATPWRIRWPESGAKHAAIPSTLPLWPAPAVTALSQHLAPPQSPAAGDDPCMRVSPSRKPAHTR